MNKTITQDGSLWMIHNRKDWLKTLRAKRTAGWLTAGLVLGWIVALWLLLR